VYDHVSDPYNSYLKQGGCTIIVHSHIKFKHISSTALINVALRLVLYRFADTIQFLWLLHFNCSKLQHLTYLKTPLNTGPLMTHLT